MFDSYIKYFDRWKEEDKFNLLNDYIYMYKQCEGNLMILEKEENELYSYSKKFIEGFQKKIILNAEKICPEFEEYITEFTVKPVKIKFNSSLMSTARKAYFDFMKINLEEEKYDVLENFLNELQQRLINLTPNNQRECDYLREYFDVELIMGMIRNKAFSFENFNNWSRFILNRIAKYQKPIDDEKHKKWVSDFYNKIDSREFNVSIIKFLEYSIIRVEEIEKDIKQYNENTRSI